MRNPAITLIIFLMFSCSEVPDTKILCDCYSERIKKTYVQGEGKYYQDDKLVYEGGWINNRYNGKGKLYQDENLIYDGYWKEGKKQGQGTYNYENGHKYIGSWKDDKYEGEGTYYYDLLSSKDGVFKNGELWDGIYTSYQETGIIYKIYYNEGDPTDTIRNDRNYYINEDIIGEDIFCTKKLLNQNNRFEIRCNINNISVEWIFDTGAESISIAASEWDKIKSEIDFEDLKISAKSMGIGGFQTGKMIRINDEITIGCYSVKNTVVYITNGEYNLMGIGFLNKFSNVEWNMKESTIKLFK